MFATRRDLMAMAAAGALLAACQKPGAGGAKAGGEDPSDMAIGDPKAKVQLIEYASVTCSHCREFHEKVWPALKANYIDQGKVRFVFREFPTNPVEIAVAGFQVARCAADAPEKYFSVLDVLFDQQNAVFDALERGGARDVLLNIAKSAGVSEDKFNACITDPAGVKRVQATVDRGEKLYKVQGTPTLILNGQKLEDPSAYTYDGLAKLIDAKLGAA